MEETLRSSPNVMERSLIDVGTKDRRDNAQIVEHGQGECDEPQPVIEVESSQEGCDGHVDSDKISIVSYLMSVGELGCRKAAGLLHCNEIDRSSGEVKPRERSFAHFDSKSDASGIANEKVKRFVGQSIGNITRWIMERLRKFIHCNSAEDRSNASKDMDLEAQMQQPIGFSEQGEQIKIPEIHREDPLPGTHSPHS